MLVRRLALVWGLVALASCSQQSTPSGEGGAAPSGQPAQIEPLLTYNIGDVETSMELTVKLAPRSQGQNVQYLEMETKRSELAMAEARIGSPYPESLWLVSATSLHRKFPEGDAIVVRQRIYVETREEPVAEQAFVWSGSTPNRETKSLEVDLIPLLNSLTGSVLVHARAEVLWFVDTDPASVDPANLTQTPQGRVEILSNSLRITFE